MPLLASPHHMVQIYAAGVLRNLSDADSRVVQLACARAGAAVALLCLLSSSGIGQDVREQAAIALRQLSGCHVAHRRAIMAQPGSIGTLQHLLQDPAATPAALSSALCALRHLNFDDHTAAILPAVPAVLRHLRHPHADVARQAASLLADLARYHTGAKQAIISEGGIPALTAVISSPQPTAASAPASAALGILTAGNPTAAAAAVHALGIGPGHPLEQTYIEGAVEGNAIICRRDLAHAAPNPELPLQGPVRLQLPPRASGYRQDSTARAHSQPVLLGSQTGRLSGAGIDATCILYALQLSGQAC